jgi:small-conductance mechanosensitive channel
MAVQINAAAHSIRQWDAYGGGDAVRRPGRHQKYRRATGIGSLHRTLMQINAVLRPAFYQRYDLRGLGDSALLDDIAGVLTLLPAPLVLAGAFLVTAVFIKRRGFRKRPIMRFVIQVAAFAAFSTMLVVAGVIPFETTPLVHPDIRFVTVNGFKIVWWLAAAWLLVGVFRALVFFERQPTETRFLQDLFAGIAYTSAVLAIIAYVFGMPISGLLAASGVIAIVLGLALQSTLGDLFSGFVLNISKPYHVGDWITLDRGLTGQVVEANWRATHILTLDNDLAIVPNSLITKTMVINASNPNKAHGVTIVIRLEPSVAPSEGCAVLETALLSCNEILRAPPPAVTVRALDAVALECEVQFFVARYETIIEARNEVFDLVYRHCTAAAIRLAPRPAAC